MIGKISRRTEKKNEGTPKGFGWGKQKGGSAGLAVEKSLGGCRAYDEFLGGMGGEGRGGSQGGLDEGALATVFFWSLMSVIFAVLDPWSRGAPVGPSRV